MCVLLTCQNLLSKYGKFNVFFLQNFGNFVGYFPKLSFVGLELPIFLLPSGKISPKKKSHAPTFSKFFQFCMVSRDWWNFPIFCQSFLNLQEKSESPIFFQFCGFKSLVSFLTFQSILFKLIFQKFHFFSNFVVWRVRQIYQYFNIFFDLQWKQPTPKKSSFVVF